MVGYFNNLELIDKSNISIGIDLDHTIIDYKNIFAEKAFSLGFIKTDSIMTKNEVKTVVTKLEDGEKKWGLLQVNVYSEGIYEASIMNGFPEFVKFCNKRKISLFIISHKTKTNPNDPLKRNLKNAALKWMTNNQFFESNGLGFNISHVFFNNSIDEKISRIRSQNCNYFIDDLEKVLSNSAFPINTRKIIFLSNPLQTVDIDIDYSGNWWGITKYLMR